MKNTVKIHHPINQSEKCLKEVLEFLPDAYIVTCEDSNVKRVKAINGLICFMFVISNSTWHCSINIPERLQEQWLDAYGETAFRAFSKARERITEYVQPYNNAIDKIKLVNK